MLDIFQFDFMIRAFIVGLAIAVTAPLVGIFLVVRRYSHLADTLAHVSLAGGALAALLHTQPLGPVIAVTVLAAIGIELLRNNKKLYGESLLILFLAGSLAFATIVMSFQKNAGALINSLLFGSLSTVSPTDAVVSVVLGFVLVAAVLIFYSRLFLTSFDEELAHVQGMNVRALNLGLMVIAAATIAAAIRIVGVLLVGALIVIPVITAMQFGKGFRATTIISIGFSLISVITGLFGAYYLDIASGGAITAAAVLLFIGSAVVTMKKRG